MNHPYTAFLWEQMQTLHKQQPLSGHTPGHKNGVFLPEALQQAWGSQFASYDYTELDGLDNLHFSSGCIAQSQQQAGKQAAGAPVQSENDMHVDNDIPEQSQSRGHRR